MAKELYITGQAHRDIAAILGYIAKDKPETANKIAGKIYDRIENIADMPNIGVKMSVRFGIETDVLFSIVHPYPYLAFYKNEEEKVIVLRILDGRMNYLSILDLSTGK
jgi:plasmid stabilization system protein ParE